MRCDDLIRARFVGRRKRFLADVRFDDGTEAVCHLPNSGSMATLLNPGCDAWVRPARSGNALAFTLTMLGLPAGGLALVDTQMPNRLVEEAILAGHVPELIGYAQVRREVRAPETESRFDLALGDGQGETLTTRCFVEVKSLSMHSQIASRRADFPDSPTERGRKHLTDLRGLVGRGYRCVQFYLVTRTDCISAGLAEVIDPAYAEALHEAVRAGVEVLAYRIRIAGPTIAVGRRCAFIPPWEATTRVRRRAP